LALLLNPPLFIRALPFFIIQVGISTNFPKFKNYRLYLLNMAI
jgi:hypothetical protein